MNKKLLRKKLALMLATLKKKRKYYCEVEYLESTGTQYIDTGVIIASFPMSVETSFSGSMETNNTYQVVVGSDDQYLIGLISGEPHFGFKYNNKVFDTDFPDFTDKIYTVKNNITSDGMNITIDGDEYIRPHSFVPKSEKLNLFSSKFPSKPIKMRYSKIWDNNLLVRDFIPVLDWDMTPCMYDKVSGELFYNQGTGDFVTGRQIHYVEYLESTGTQYIDTGINGYNLITSDIGVMKLTSSSNECAVGCWNDASSRCWLAYFFGHDFYAGHGTVAGSMESVSLNEWHTIKTEISGNRYNYIVDGTKHTYGDNTFNSNQNIYMFAMNNKGSAFYYSKVRISYAKIYDDGVLVRDYIPAIDENGVGYMFDRVTHTIYDNAGQGAFSYPPVYLEYLESTGTQYINTGIYPNLSNAKIEIKAIKQTAKSLFGEVDASARFNLTGDTSKNYCYYGNQPTNYGGYVPVNPDKEHTFVLDRGYFYVDGELKDSKATEGVTATYPIGLFTCITNEDGSLQNDGGSHTIFYCSIWNNNVLVRNFIPCYKDGQAGMWDIVNKTFYENKGTGNFIAGLIREK